MYNESMRWIVSNNCWGSCFYSQVWNMPYQTPFVGAYILPDEYVTLLENIQCLWAKPATVSRVTKKNEQLTYPMIHISIPGTEGVDVRFIHHGHASNDSVLHKWNERLNRMPRDPSCWHFKFDDRDGCTQEHITRFLHLPFRKKILFVVEGKIPSETNDVVEIPSFGQDTVMQGDHLWIYTMRQSDCARKINTWLEA